MKEFRLPRKTKKSLKGFYFYPLDTKTNSYLMAWPWKYEKDYRDYKAGIVKDLMDF